MGTTFRGHIGRGPDDRTTPYQDVEVLPGASGGWEAAGTRRHSTSPDVRASWHDLTWRRAMLACTATATGHRNTDAVSWRDGQFEVGAFGFSEPSHIALLVAMMLQKGPLRYVHVMRDAPFYPKTAPTDTGHTLWWIGRRRVPPRDTVAMLSCLLSSHLSCDAQAITLREIALSLDIAPPEFTHTLEYKRLWACALLGEIRHREPTRKALAPFGCGAETRCEVVIESLRESGAAGRRIVEAVETALFA